MIQKIVLNIIKQDLDDDYLLNENMVHGIYEDDDGYLWVGTKSKGVNIIDRKNNKSRFIRLKITKNNINDTINDITGKNLIFIATDDGIIKIDKESKKTIEKL